MSQRSARAAYESTDYEYHHVVYSPQPRALRSPDALAARKALWKSDTTLEPLKTYLAAAAARRPSTVTPQGLMPLFDPAEAGVHARVLFLFEAPGPMTNADGRRPGSGFVSVDNDDQTAENSWQVRNALDLADGALLWNMVPWYLGPASRKPTPVELAQGGAEARRLLPILTELRGVVLAGLVAQRGWRQHVAPFVSERRLTVIESWHPSPLSFNQPGKRDEVLRAWERAARLAR